MTWAQFAAARRVLAEDAVLAPERAMQRAEIEREEAAVATTKANLSRLPRIPIQPRANTPAVIPPRPITDEIVGSA